MMGQITEFGVSFYGYFMYSKYCQTRSNVFSTQQQKKNTLLETYSFSLHTILVHSKIN